MSLPLVSVCEVGHTATRRSMGQSPPYDEQSRHSRCPVNAEHWSGKSDTVTCPGTATVLQLCRLPASLACARVRTVCFAACFQCPELHFHKVLETQAYSICCGAANSGLTALRALPSVVHRPLATRIRAPIVHVRSNTRPCMIQRTRSRDWCNLKSRGWLVSTSSCTHGIVFGFWMAREYGWCGTWHTIDRPSSFSCQKQFPVDVLCCGFDEHGDGFARQPHPPASGLSVVSVYAVFPL
jgi:hypothetical protein